MIWNVGVVGDPVDHSLSPQLQEAAMQIAGIEGNTSRVQISSSQVDDLKRAIRNDFDALSVTMPLKPLATTICDHLDPAATRTGMVNSLLRKDGQIYGACTDGEGLISSVKSQFNFDFADARVVVIGAGGAASGIIDALQNSNARSITVLNRTTSKIDALSAKYNKVTSALGDRVDVLINTVPITGRGTPEMVAGIHAETICIDITYAPAVSKWLAFFEAEGCRTANGLGMLAHQAALQFKFWWNVDIDGEDLLEVLT